MKQIKIFRKLKIGLLTVVCFLIIGPLTDERMPGPTIIREVQGPVVTKTNTIVREVPVTNTNTIIREIEKKTTQRKPHQKDVDKCDLYSKKLENLSSKVFSQWNQDNILNLIFKDYRNGVFIDLAAAFPRDLSNTYYLETCLGWTGVCFEADPRKVINLLKGRTCQLIPECVTETTREVNFGSTVMDGGNAINKTPKKGSISLTCHPFGELLEKYGSEKHIDFMSLDIEGSEPGALKSLPDDYVIDLIAIEIYHIRNDEESNKVLRWFFKKHDYVPVIGFPTNKTDYCNNGEPGNNIWDMDLDELFGEKYSDGDNKVGTHDVLFIRRDSKHFERVKQLFDCNNK